MNRITPHCEHPRRGFLLVVVLVVISLAALVCYQFADRMTTERQVVNGYVTEAQATQAAMSGIDFLLSWMADPEFDVAALATLPAEEYAFQAVLPGDETQPEPNDLQCIFVSRHGTSQTGELTFGVSSEGGKINLNGLVTLDVSEDEQREMLIFLPEMTDTLADTILDFIDADNTPRDFGTESDNGDYIVRNTPLNSLDDLLAIPEITAALLYGEDANRNGLLDPNEDDGDLTLPLDDADGILFPGWQHYLTIWSRESNLRSDGEPKINVNMDDLDLLEQLLLAEFEPEVVDFIIKYRRTGPADSFDIQYEPPAENSSSNSAPVDRNAPPSGSNSQGNSKPSSGGPGSGSASGSGGAGGGAAQIRLRSLYELIDAGLAPQEGTDSNPESLIGVELSPWTSDDLSFLPQMEEALTINEEETQQGRIDLNFATYESLAGLPNMPTALIEAIMTGAGNWTSVGDLLAQGLTDVPTIQKLEPFLTTRSQTYRVTSTGLWRLGGPIVRIEAVFDTAAAEPVLLSIENLTRLGPGYTREQLLTTPTLNSQPSTLNPSP